MKALAWVFVWCCLSSAAHAEFRCAVEARDGFAEADAKGSVTGPAVAFCRSIADQLASPSEPVRVILIEPDTGAGMPPAEVALFSAELILERKLTATLHLGPPVFHDPVTLLVPNASPVRQPPDIAGRIVCFMIGGPGETALESRLSTLTPPPIRLGFREPDEMRDAYNVGRCDGTIGTRSELAQMQLETGINNLQSRILADAVDDAPILLTVEARNDALVARLDQIKLP